jgi:hypothetical protein
MGSGKVYAREALSKKQIRKIELEQFEDLPDSFREVRRELRAKAEEYFWCEDSDEAVARRDELKYESFQNPKLEKFPEYLDLKVPHIAGIIDNIGEEEKRNLDSKVLDAYIFRICQYANNRRIAHRQGQKKFGKERNYNRQNRSSDPGEGPSAQKGRPRSRSPKAGKKSQYRTRDGTEDVHTKDADEHIQPDFDDDEHRLSCICFGFDTIRSIVDSDPGSLARDDLIDQALDSMLLNRKLGLKTQFVNLDYLLIPHATDDFIHYSLGGIAPRQKFLFAIDSFGKELTIHNQPLHTILDIALSQIPDWYEDDLPQDWLVYGHWSKRGAQNLDNSPPCVRQADAHNCGVFTATNAMCLAFGYEMTCYASEDADEDSPWARALVQKRMDQGKRERMACELWNGGFRKPFDYDLLEIPWVRGVGMEAKRIKIRIPAEKMRAAKQGAAKEMVALTNDDGGDVEIGDQYGFFSSPSPPLSPESSNTSSQALSPIATARTPLPLAPQPQPQPQPTNASPSASTSVPLQDTGPTPWPPQFPPPHFERRTLLFAVSQAEKTFWRNKKTKKELKAACRARGLQGWSVWSKGDIKVFRRWCENESMAMERWREVRREEEGRGRGEGKVEGERDREKKGNGEGGTLVWPVEGMGVRRTGGRDRGRGKKGGGGEEKEDFKDEKDDEGRGGRKGEGKGKESKGGRRSEKVGGKKT